MNSTRILVVDDEPQLRHALRATLSALGFIVEDAESGETALDIFRNENFDLILLDMNMPGMSGLETCKAIRTHSDVNIIILTVRDRTTDKIEALDAGADGYVTKPFDLSELLARIRATLRRSASGAAGKSQVVQIDDIVVSFRDRRISMNDRTARLTPKELDLLRYLITHPNTVLPHHQILQAVWGPDYGNEVEYLRVFVNQLRKKFEPSPSQPRYILTEPWIGYRFYIPQPDRDNPGEVPGTPL